MQTNTKDKKKLVIINLFMQINFSFFSIFFNIYAYQITKNLNIILSYLFMNQIINLVVHLAIYKIINKKLLNIIYRLSFIMCIPTTMLIFLVNSDRVYLIFIIQAMYIISETAYYFTHEISVMSKNTKSQMKKFVGVNNALGLVAAVLSPLISGYVIDFISYYVLFGVMIGIAAICFIISLYTNLVNDEIVHIPIKNYFSYIKHHKPVMYGYFGYAIGRFSKNGPVEILLPVLIFMRTSTNYRVGIYASLAALIAGITLMLYTQFGKHKTIGMWICTISRIIVSITLILSGSIVIFFIYYFVQAITTKLLNTDINSSLFVLVNHTELQPYKIEQNVAYVTFSAISLMLSCIVCFILYNCLNDIISLSIYLAFASCMQIVSTLLITKSDRMLQKTKTFQYQITDNA